MSLQFYSIAASARASTDDGMVMPSASATLRLMTSSYLVGACHREVGRLLALVDTINISGGAAISVRGIRSIGHQAADGDKVSVVVNCGQPVVGRKRDDRIALSHRRKVRSARRIPPEVRQYRWQATV